MRAMGRAGAVGKEFGEALLREHPYPGHGGRGREYGAAVC